MLWSVGSIRSRIYFCNNVSSNILKRLINTLQLENLSISKFKLALDNTIKDITSEFIGYVDVLPNYGVIFRKYLDEYNQLVPSFVREYSLAIIESISNRFPESELYFSFNIFDPKELPDDERDLIVYGINEVAFLDKFYGETKFVGDNEFYGIIEKGKLIEEWSPVKSYLQLYKNMELYFNQLWNIF